MLISYLKNPVIAGYQVIEPIDSGGMGEVYKAFNQKLNRWAAIKLLKQEEMLDRFKNEAYIQSLIVHSNIVQLYELTYFQGAPCLILEYVEGLSLDAYIRQKGKLSSEETEKVLYQIVSALSYLHQKGIIHRDLKPQNFKVQPNGTIKMLDFGIAKNRSTPKLTQVGFIVGTIEYMAPEQFQHIDTTKSDMWSLGVMTYQMITGYLPFEESDILGLRRKIAKAEYTKPHLLNPGISKKLVFLIDKCLQVPADNRITAVGMVNFLSSHDKGKATPLKSNRNTFKLAGIKPVYIIGVILLASVLVLILKQPSTAIVKPSVQVPQKSVKIDVPNVDNAFIVLPNGIRKPVPYELKGTDGEIIDFILHAEGYEDKKVRIEITPRRRSYEYNLENASN